ncbi:unnamed protein product [Toxocara canis]|uniref:DNA_pol_alpha_N domain-containing protein n=1 Tax=Toxocara canis TaxID=6265 RepID=A0A183U3H8_TOXCA|nr:unnamed protein product [Toxocara canis]
MSSSDEELLVRNPFTAPSSGGERRSSRRVHVSRHKETQSKALEEVRRARASGLCHRIDVDSLIKPVYEEVDEDEYINIVRERQSDDFVVDDDGSGYVDHGVDIFDDDHEMEAESTMKRKREKKGYYCHSISDGHV